jgi:hypothetical protein
MDTALDELVKAFEEWRTTRARPSSRVPQELLERARSLGNEFDEKEICGRIRYPRYKVFPIKLNPDRPRFVEVSANNSQPSHSQAPITVDIVIGSRALKVHFSNGNDLSQFFSSLLKI